MIKRHQTDQSEKLGSGKRFAYFAFMIEQELLVLLLPEGMLDYFEITAVEKQPDAYLIYLSD